MCKYCELDKDGIAEPLVSGLGVCCELVIEKNNYYLVIYGDSEVYSEPVHYCPFCGRELKIEENKTEEFSSVCDYLKSLDDGTREGINYEKWRYGVDYYMKHQDISIDDFLNHIEKKFNKKSNVQNSEQ